MLSVLMNICNWNISSISGIISELNIYIYIYVRYPHLFIDVPRQRAILKKNM